jgi:putative DNA primase/helicase
VLKEPQAVGRQPFIIDPNAPLAIARLVLEMLHTEDGHRTLYHHKSVFYGWNGTAYPETEAAALRTQMYHFLEQCAVIDDKGRLWPYKPNAARVNRVLDALRAESFLAEGMAAPVWLEQTPDLPPDQIIACENGLLHIPTREVLPHTPLFFTHNALDFAYQQKAAPPFQWLRFLKLLWPDDGQSRRILQEIFGYALTADTSQQKAFLVIGPKRSGKGTIGRVLARLVGIANAAAPTLASLGMNFGLAPLIGKRLAIISDARLGSRADQQIIVERLLSITGEDALTIDRKFLPAWTGRLQCRFLVLTNEIPQIADASGALVSRFVVLILRESFYGREDHNLSSRLLGELPGILHWSLKGLERLLKRCSSRIHL